MPQEMILKLQRSVFTNKEVGQILIYNEDKSLLHQTDMTPTISALFGNKLKVYVDAKFHPNGHLELLRVTSPQKW